MLESSEAWTSNAWDFRCLRIQMLHWGCLRVRRLELRMLGCSEDWEFGCLVEDPWELKCLGVWRLGLQMLGCSEDWTSDAWEFRGLWLHILESSEAWEFRGLDFKCSDFRAWEFKFWTLARSLATSTVCWRYSYSWLFECLLLVECNAFSLNVYFQISKVISMCGSHAEFFQNKKYMFVQNLTHVREPCWKFSNVCLF